jgi:hypothetical protein
MLNTMFDWMKRRASIAHDQPAADGEEAKGRQGCVVSGKYLSLYTYLENRYANTVVLTFAEIEDLLGFTLPELARLHPEWWTNADPNARPSHSDSWVLASRTARPNLRAQTVVFERAS